ncbi:MAG: hypothetical protein RLZ71_534 [Actinomycetota bacterium]|jgi:peptide/nickel transport system permease protein
MAKKSEKKSPKSAEGATSIEMKEVDGLSQGQIVRRRFVRHRAAMIATFTLIFVIIFAFTASGIHLGTQENPITVDGWWKWHSLTEGADPMFSDECPLGGCPTLDLNPFSKNFGIGEHPFGQDDVGVDYFAMVMRGIENSVMVMIVIGFLGGFLGTVVGAVSGFFRGRIDAVLMRFTDLMMTIPVIIIGAVIGFRVGNLGVAVLGVCLGLFAWTGLSRLVRGEFLTLREREFVDAARVAGASNSRIIFKHILPNAIGVIIVSVTLSMSGAILLETGLSFIGFGVVWPDVSLGSIISTYQNAFTTRPWLFWWPGLFIITIALCINFIGDGLRDAFDPRQRRRITRADRLKARTAAKEMA